MPVKILNFGVKKSLEARVMSRVQGKEATLLIDSGADASCVDLDWFNVNYNSDNVVDVEDIEQAVLFNANGERMPHTRVVLLTVALGETVWEEEFYIVKDLPVKLLIGLPTMVKVGIDLLSSKQMIRIGDIRLPFLPREEEQVRKEAPPSTHLLHLEEELKLPAHCEVYVNCIVGKMKHMRGVEQNIVISSANSSIEDKQIYAARGVNSVYKYKIFHFGHRGTSIEERRYSWCVSFGRQGVLSAKRCFRLG
jgi:hypothetical protein